MSGDGSPAGAVSRDGSPASAARHFAEPVAGHPADLVVVGVDGSLGSGDGFYFLCLVVAVLSTLGILNLLRSPTGRAFVAIRDSEISASCMGVNLATYKTLSFAISAALTGIGGALYAHKVTFISPEQFTLLQP